MEIFRNNKDKSNTGNPNDPIEGQSIYLLKQDKHLQVAENGKKGKKQEI